MPTKNRKPKIASVPEVIQLPCRARPHEAALIRKGAELDTRGNTTTFIISAALSAAKIAIAAHGVTEADVLAEADASSKKRA